MKPEVVLSLLIFNLVFCTSPEKDKLMKLLKRKGIDKLYTAKLKEINQASVNLNIEETTEALPTPSYVNDFKKANEENKISINDSKTDGIVTKPEVDLEKLEAYLKTEMPDIQQKCPNLKNGVKMETTMMVGLWQTIYHDMTSPVACFKIVIKKLDDKQQDIYKSLYGDFNGDVTWEDCLLEIRADSDDGSWTRKHFLQASYEDQDLGVFSNIIINREGNGTTTFHQDSADQWRLIGDLLLMRDCVTGGLVVFGKTRPRLDDIVKAILLYGHEYVDGRLLCDYEGL